MRTLKKRNLLGPGGGAIVRQFILIIKDIREEDYGENRRKVSYYESLCQVTTPVRPPTLWARSPRI